VLAPALVPDLGAWRRLVLSPVWLRWAHADGPGAMLLGAPALL
jgi:hypothetical protein